MFIIKGKLGYVKKLEGKSWIYTTDMWSATNFEGSKKAEEFIRKCKVGNGKLMYCMPCSI